MTYTTTSLLDAIKRRSFAPANQLTFTDVELLAIADEVMRVDLLPDILKVREEFFVSYTDTAITAGQKAYSISARAVGLLLRDVHYVVGTDVKADFPRKEPEQFTSDALGSPTAFALRNNTILLDPTPGTTVGTLRQLFFLAPGDLVALTAAAVVASIDTLTSTVTLTAIPSTWSTGNVFDLIRQDGGQEPIAIDQTSTLVSGSTITFASLPSAPFTVRVGDYVALAGQTPLPHMPPNYRDVLAQGVAAEVLDMSNQPGSERARKRYDEMRKTAQTLITPRVQGEDRLITPRNWFNS